MTDKEKLTGMRKAIKYVIAYPPKSSGRRTKNGYPKEFDYDRFAYERMIDSVRAGLREILKEFK